LFAPSAFEILVDCQDFSTQREVIWPHSPTLAPEKLIEKECVSSLTNSHQADAQEILFQRPPLPSCYMKGRCGGEKSPTARGVGEKESAFAKIAPERSYFPFFRASEFKPRKPPAARVSLLILNSVKRNLFLSFSLLWPHRTPARCCAFFTPRFSRRRRSPCAAFSLSLSFFCQTPRRPLLNFHSKSQFKFLFTWPSRRTVMAENLQQRAKERAFYALKWVS